MPDHNTMQKQLITLFDCLSETQQAELIKIARILVSGHGEWIVTEPSVLWPMAR